VTHIWERTIVHADMDAFYAAVEQLDDPSLRGRPLLIGPDSPRGVVLTASYEARPFGVGSAMPMHRARRLCPQALIVPPRFDRYQEVSSRIMRCFGDFSPDVEALSLDEAFIDMTGSERLLGSPATIGAKLKAAVREVTGGLTASVGISATRFVAKVASGFRKPDGLTIVAPGDARSWLAPMPVSNLWGAGAKTAARLRDLGLETIRDVAVADPEWLVANLGTLGVRFHELANAVDARSVDGTRRVSSVGSEHTLNSDIAARADIEQHLRAASEIVAQRLRKKRLVAGGVRVKLKRSDFRIVTRQCVLAESTDVGATLLANAVQLLAAVDDRGPFRLVGLTAYDLTSSAGGKAQLDLLTGEGSRARRLEVALDGIAAKFGSGAVQRAADLTRDRGVVPPANLDFLDD
jgi:DNA polymerase-4